MENELNEIKEELIAENDEIKIADDVIAIIAGVAASEVPGVYSMSGGFSGGSYAEIRDKNG